MMLRPLINTSEWLHCSKRQSVR